MAKFCFKCGTPIEEGNDFCPECGAKQPVKSAAQAPAVQYAAQPMPMPMPAPAPASQPAPTQRKYNGILPFGLKIACEAAAFMLAAVSIVLFVVHAWDEFSGVVYVYSIVMFALTLGLSLISGVFMIKDKKWAHTALLAVGIFWLRNSIYMVGGIVDSYNRLSAIMSIVVIAAVGLEIAVAVILAKKDKQKV